MDIKSAVDSVIDFEQAAAVLSIPASSPPALWAPSAILVKQGTFYKYRVVPRPHPLRHGLCRDTS